MTKKIYIDGMSCSHCVKRVENSLKSLDGVGFVNVSLEEKVATVEVSKDINDEEFIKAIDDAGYTVTKIE